MIVITALPIIREASSNPCSGLETKSGSIDVGVPSDDDTHPYLRNTRLLAKKCFHTSWSQSDSSLRLSWPDIYRKEKKRESWIFLHLFNYVTQLDTFFHSKAYIKRNTYDLIIVYINIQIFNKRTSILTFSSLDSDVRIIGYKRRKT